jgi:hypothetical protein
VSSAAPTTEQQTAAPDRDEQTVSSSQQAGSEKVKLKKTRKVARWVLAVDAWQRQIDTLKRRASFTLLRRVIRAEKNQSNKIIQLADIPTSDLERSLLSHCLILLFVVPASIWAAYTTIKGFSAGIRFDLWFNAWLLQGTPMLVFSVVKMLTSNKSRTLIQRELTLRANNPTKE